MGEFATYVTNLVGFRQALGGLRIWTVTIPANGDVWTEQVGVTVAPDSAGSLVNGVQVTSVEGARGQYTQISTVGRVIYLPLIWRGR